MAVKININRPCIGKIYFILVNRAIKMLILAILKKRQILVVKVFFANDCIF